MMNQTRTFLKVFVEVSEADEKSDDNIAYPPSSLGSKSMAVSRPTALSRSHTAPDNHRTNSISSAQSQYCTISIHSNSTAADVCNAVARKRNLLYTEDEYELVMCDGDGEQSYETILGVNDQPHQFQQSAAKHGHLGDFHFVFRRVKDDTGSEADDADSDADSDADMFPTQTHVKVFGVLLCCICILHESYNLKPNGMKQSHSLILRHCTSTF